MREFYEINNGKAQNRVNEKLISFLIRTIIHILNENKAKDKFYGSLSEKRTLE